MQSHNICEGIIQSGRLCGQQCTNRARDNGYCGNHISQCINKVSDLYFINSSGTSIELYNNEELITYIWPFGIYKLQIHNDYNIENYKILYLDYNLIVNIYDDNIIHIGDIKQIVISLTKSLNREIELKNKWKSVALKSLRIPLEIKKLNSSDTVNELCDLTLYIDLPEEITDRDYQLAGATYNPDDEDIVID